LTPAGRKAGLVDDERWSRFADRQQRFARNRKTLDTTLVRTSSGDRVFATRLLRQPQVRLAQLIESEAVNLEMDIASHAIDVASLETSIKFDGYLRRQASEIERARREERRRIPEGFPFDRVPGLSREVVQRLNQIRPDTLAHALRIPGVTPAAVAVLGAYVGRVF
jgi:tRNA uridine 5-carboxymethylaminomethyl modification enzyme